MVDKINNYIEHLCCKYVIVDDSGDLGRSEILTKLEIDSKKKVNDAFLIALTRDIMSQFSVRSILDQERLDAEAVYMNYKTYKTYKTHKTPPRPYKCKQGVLVEHDSSIDSSNMYYLRSISACMKLFFGKGEETGAPGDRWTVEYKLSMKRNGKRYNYSIYDWTHKDGMYSCWHIAGDEESEAVVGDLLEYLIESEMQGLESGSIRLKGCC
jgi:hypothetical protein